MKMSPATADLLGQIAPGMADRLRSGLVVDFDEELVERLVRAAREAGPLVGPTVPLMIDGAVVGHVLADAAAKMATGALGEFSLGYSVGSADGK